MTFPSAADLSIANQALGACRARTQQITNFTDPSPEATQINLNYSSTRDALLRSFYWNFAKSTVDLGTPLKTYDATAIAWSNAQPPPPWYYEYAFPTGCLALREVIAPTPCFGPAVMYTDFSASDFYSGDFSVSVPILPVGIGTAGRQFAIYEWEVVNDGGAKVIVTNAASALGIITLQITDPNVWDIEFQQAMIALLAASICLPLSGDAELKKGLENDAEQWLLRAEVKAANEGTDRQSIVPDWIRARNS